MDYYKITQQQDGGCTSKPWQWRVMAPVIMMSKVFDLHCGAFMHIPFPDALFTAGCFSHPIWELLTENQKDRVNNYGMSFDPMCCNYDNEHCEFFESRLGKLKDPYYCSYYVETGLDPMINRDGIDIERTYDNAPPYRFIRFNTHEITSLIRMFLEPDEAGSAIVYEHKSPGLTQYDVVNFSYDMDRLLMKNTLDLANAVMHDVWEGEQPHAIMNASPEEGFKALFLAMVADDSGIVLWDVGLYLMQYICVSMPNRLWFAKKLCRRIFGSNNNTVRIKREENYNWFVRNADDELNEIIQELRQPRRLF